MSDLAIEVDSISKVFRLGRPRAVSLREALVNVISASKNTSSRKLLWALRDINFSVRRGQTYGVIGGNGAGKSTLLKVLTGITRPTSGRATIRGRICSLLEVGSGFHNELSGRENVFLNGAILGMTKGETSRKLDEIVSFAGLEDFLDTPVKHYSSGMYVRLAFSIAAHLDFEIMIVDEVLSVGDASFKQRSFEKIRELSRTGRTILLTSHDMSLVESLCERALWLSQGEVVADGDTADIAAQYIASVAHNK